eukprot:GEMP01007497.1.p1 GENE.GEMP01007497.1~~GEMP01007497.1.p1  ORF type:complete len:644 (+),score=124.65 GEMP01007497.1:982-2913(+)
MDVCASCTNCTLPANCTVPVVLGSTSATQRLVDTGIYYNTLHKGSNENWINTFGDAMHNSYWLNGVLKLESEILTVNHLIKSGEHDLWDLFNISTNGANYRPWKWGVWRDATAANLGVVRGFLSFKASNHDWLASYDVGGKCSIAAIHLVIAGDLSALRDFAEFKLETESMDTDFLDVVHRIVDLFTLPTSLWSLITHISPAEEDRQEVLDHLDQDAHNAGQPFVDLVFHNASRSLSKDLKTASPEQAQVLLLGLLNLQRVLQNLCAACSPDLTLLFVHELGQGSKWVGEHVKKLFYKIAKARDEIKDLDQQTSERKKRSAYRFAIQVEIAEKRRWADLYVHKVMCPAIHDALAYEIVSGNIEKDNAKARKMLFFLAGKMDAGSSSDRHPCTQLFWCGAQQCEGQPGLQPGSYMSEYINFWGLAAQSMGKLAENMGPTSPEKPPDMTKIKKMVWDVKYVARRLGQMEENLGSAMYFVGKDTHDFLDRSQFVLNSQVCNATYATETLAHECFAPVILGSHAYTQALIEADAYQDPRPNYWSSNWFDEEVEQMEEKMFFDNVLNVIGGTTHDVNKVGYVVKTVKNIIGLLTTHLWLDEVSGAFLAIHTLLSSVAFLKMRVNMDHNMFRPDAYAHEGWLFYQKARL